MSRAPKAGVGLLAALLATGCAPRESPDAARDRAVEAFLVAQIADLKGLIARAEKGDFVSRDRIAISLSEDIVKELLDATLPQEVTLAGRVRVTVISAQPFFRGNNAALLFQAVARGVDAETPTARVEIGGSLERVRIERGRLIADVSLAHFEVLDTSLGSMAADALEGLVKDNKEAFAGLLRAVEIPVRLEQAVEIPGLREGIITARPGALPLTMVVAEVVPVRQRLWVLVDAKAGPWQEPADAEAKR
jgi:hypothetical protein